MRFELEPDNRGVEDRTLLDDLRRVARELDKESLSQTDYNRLGRFHSAAIKNRLGWNRALELAGLSIRKRANVSRDELIDDLRRVAAGLGSGVLTIGAYKRLGKFSVPPIQRHFGGFRIAVKQAGLTPLSKPFKRVADGELHRNLEMVWRSLGRQPKRDNMRPPLSEFGPGSYVRRFGSWRKALESFVEFVNSATVDVPAPATDTPNSANEQPADATAEHLRTPRSVSWRLRFLVMRRDRFKCCFCGVSPATTPGASLVIDHVLAWSKGGETLFNNLQTLCEKCNGGKSDLMMDDA